MTEYHLLTVAESTGDDEDGYRRSLVSGPLADAIRARFNASDPVYVHEHVEHGGHCDTCASIDNVLTVECGPYRRSFAADEGIPLPALLDWLDEPRRRALAAAAKRIRSAEANGSMDAAVSDIVAALNAVEEAGYGNEYDWFQKFSARLGFQ
ncbi:hypothetical protein [Nocardia thailandica]|uniref:hypothetical protein n=1 Tax=Nocardia thailandica TaxID=257275 RepID=UPI00031BE9D7|nr:hypothetical protein [Nocardia thailandica]